MPTATEDWNQLSQALRVLHRALAKRARIDYAREKQIDPEIGPIEMLRLLTDEPWFNWLRELSELMVDLELIHESGNADEMAAAARASIEYFVTPPNDGETPHAFAERYWTYVQEDPEVAMAHGDVKRALSTFPATKTRERKHLWEHRVRLGATAREGDDPLPRGR